MSKILSSAPRGSTGNVVLCSVSCLVSALRVRFYSYWLRRLICRRPCRVVRTCLPGSERNTITEQRRAVRDTERTEELRCFEPRGAEDRIFELDCVYQSTPDVQNPHGITNDSDPHNRRETGAFDSVEIRTHHRLSNSEPGIQPGQRQRPRFSPITRTSAIST